MSAAVWPQFLMQSCCLRPITDVRRITVLHPSDHCNVPYSSVTIAYTRLYSLWEIAFFPLPEVGRWFSNIGVQSAHPSNLWFLY